MTFTSKPYNCSKRGQATTFTYTMAVLDAVAGKSQNDSDSKVTVCNPNNYYKHKTNCGRHENLDNFSIK